MIVIINDRIVSIHKYIMCLMQESPVETNDRAFFVQ
jgi:hypothetical protein